MLCLHLLFIFLFLIYSELKIKSNI